MAAWNIAKFWINRDAVPSTERASVGRQFESLSKAVYLFSGIRIIAKNKRFDHREIDLLGFDPRRKTLVVIEVRGRQKPGHSALHWITAQKMKNLKACANQIACRSRMPVQIELIEWVGIVPKRKLGQWLLWWRLRVTGRAAGLSFRKHRLQ